MKSLRKKKRIQRRFSYYTDEPESMHVPPLLQLTWRQGLTPHWPTLRPNAGFPKSWNFPSLLVRSCTSKMHPYKETHAAFRVMSIIFLVGPGEKVCGPSIYKKLLSQHSDFVQHLKLHDFINFIESDLRRFLQLAFKVPGIFFSIQVFLANPLSITTLIFIFSCHNSILSRKYLL